MSSWIPECEASARLMRKPRTLRKLVKAGTLNISYTNVNGRSFFYSERDIERYLDRNAVKVKTA